MISKQEEYNITITQQKAIIRRTVNIEHDQRNNQNGEFGARKTKQSHEESFVLSGIIYIPESRHPDMGVPIFFSSHFVQFPLYVSPFETQAHCVLVPLCISFVGFHSHCVPALLGTIPIFYQSHRISFPWCTRPVGSKFHFCPSIIVSQSRCVSVPLFTSTAGS